jgi:hypothetical protein
MGKLFNLFEHFIMIDLLRDRRIRPVLAYTLFLLALGTLLFRWLEGWSWVDAFYFCAITLFTIGYGDLTPTTEVAKLVTVLYAFNGVGVLVAFASQAMQVRAEHRQEIRERIGDRLTTSLE